MAAIIICFKCRERVALEEIRLGLHDHMPPPEERDESLEGPLFTPNFNPLTW